jgi:TetR/AcrR family transcriptional regulator
MPRRTDLARRAELAGAAVDVLRTRGMQTSMRELADALGIKRPTLYFYFSDLGAMFRAVLDPLNGALAEAVASRVRAHDHPIDRLRAAIDAALAFHRDRPQLVAGLGQLWALGGRGLERERRAMLAAREALVADLRAGIARNEVRPCDPERIVDLVLAFIAGAVASDVLGIAIDAPADELAHSVLEPLRTRRRKRARGDAPARHKRDEKLVPKQHG